jgi:hypothetical protein
MTRSLKTLSTILAFILLLTGISCSPGSCFEETNSYLKGFFYLKSTGKAFPPDSLTMYGSGRDTSLIYNKAKNVKPALLPLNASTTESSLVLKINGVLDTLKVSYSSNIHFISKECGYTYYHIIESINYTTNLIDTVTIIRSNVTTLNEENIRIYY